MQNSVGLWFNPFPVLSVSGMKFHSLIENYSHSIMPEINSRILAFIAFPSLSFEP